jgi:hypothetical protein
MNQWFQQQVCLVTVGIIVWSCGPASGAHFAFVSLVVQCMQINYLHALVLSIGTVHFLYHMFN